MKKDYIEISTYFFMEDINKKENKEVGTICFELGIPKKKEMHLETFTVTPYLIIGIFPGSLQQYMTIIYLFILQRKGNKENFTNDLRYFV